MVVAFEDVATLASVIAARATRMVLRISLSFAWWITASHLTAS
jgi:hypothetical protein